MRSCSGRTGSYELRSRAAANCKPNRLIFSGLQCTRGWHFVTGELTIRNTELESQFETQLVEYLTDDLPLDRNVRELVLKSYGAKNDIDFTHADLNTRSVQADRNGRVFGSVDWKCAGWYPEYREYTNPHFSARYNIQ
jgi:hypothetical protein